MTNAVATAVRTEANPLVFSPPLRAIPGRPLILFLPGIGGSARMGAPLVRELPDAAVVTVTPRLTIGGGSPSIMGRAESVARAVRQTLADQHLVVLGHSLGATVGFEVVRLLNRDQPGRVHHVVLAAQVAPHRLPRFTPGELTDGQVIRYVTGGEPLPTELATSSDLLAALVGHWRGEYSMFGDYLPDREPTTADLHVWVGAADPVTADPASVRLWQDYTTGHTSVTEFAGGHDFLYDDLPSTAHELAALLD